MAEKTEAQIFDFIWGNTLGLIGEGYHITVKESSEKLYLSYSVDLKYGELKFDENKIAELVKDLKSLRVDSWNGKTYSKSEFEEGDTWHLTVNHIGMILDAKGANDYPPEWTEFLNYLHIKFGIPVSRREDPSLPKKHVSESQPQKKQRDKNRDGKGKQPEGAQKNKNRDAETKKQNAGKDPEKQTQQKNNRPRRFRSRKKESAPT